MLDDVTISVLQAAMHGLSARQSAISQDIANVNTPYYRARNVTFEDSLKAAIQNGDNPLSVQPTTSYSQVEGGLNGNNVDLAAETTASVETEMSYELALRATSDRFNLINTAIKGVLIMFQAMNITGSGMEVHQLWMNAISDNIANINTVTPTNEKAFQARYVVAQSVEGGQQGVGAGVTTAGVKLGSAEGQLVYDSTNPLADGQGYVRHPDIDLGDQMSEMIMAQRGFQANTANFDRVRAAYQAAINMGEVI